MLKFPKFSTRSKAPVEAKISILSGLGHNEARPFPRREIVWKVIFPVIPDLIGNPYTPWILDSRFRGNDVFSKGFCFSVPSVVANDVKINIKILIVTKPLFFFPSTFPSGSLGTRWKLDSSSCSARVWMTESNVSFVPLFLMEMPLSGSGVFY